MTPLLHTLSWALLSLGFISAAYWVRFNEFPELASAFAFVGSEVLL